VSWAIVFVRDGGSNPHPGWYVTDNREILTLACQYEAIREGQRLLDANDFQATRFFVKRYEPTSKWEFVSCQGPDLSGLNGWLT
jgi:hypothetical protein